MPTVAARLLRLAAVGCLLALPLVLAPQSSEKAVQSGINAGLWCLGLDDRILLRPATDRNPMWDTEIVLTVPRILRGDWVGVAPYDIRHQFLFPAALFVLLVSASERTLRRLSVVLLWSLPILVAFLLLRMAAATSIFSMTDPLPWVTWDPFKQHVQRHLHAAIAFAPWYVGAVLIWAGTIVQRLSGGESRAADSPLSPVAEAQNELCAGRTRG